MKDKISKINSRIKQRNISNIETTFKNKKEKKHSFFYSLVMSTMVIMSVALGVLIYGKHDENGSFLKEKFNIDIDFTQINQKLSEFLELTVVFSIQNFNPTAKNTSVGAENLFYQLSANTFYNEKSLIYAFDNGIVSKTSNKSLVISYDDGVLVQYLFPCNLKVKPFDRVYNNLVVADYYDTLEMYFYYHGETITYGQAISIFG